MVDVLLISYFFPPAGGGGVIRALKLAKYLPEFGYIPTVIAADDPRYGDGDPALLEQVPSGVRVYRVPVVDPFGWPARLYKGLRRVGRNRPEKRAEASTRESFGARVRRVASFPDPFFRFYAPAIKGFFHIPRTYKLRAIISTAPPYVGHLIGARLSYITGLPLILDYRDAWTYNPFSGPPTRFHGAGWRLMEQKILSNAKAVVTVTEGMADDYRRRFRLEAPLYTITNGYDEEDFARIVPEKRDKFTVVYAGKFYVGRDPFTFFEGVRMALSAGALNVDDFEIRFVGVVPESIRTAAASAGIPVVVRYNVPHKEAISEIVSAHANLLIIGEGPGTGTTLTGKIFEYIRAGRPIIAMVPPAGEAAQLVRETGTGYVVSPTDAEGVASVLSNLYRLYRAGELGRTEVPTSIMEQYERKSIAGRFAELFDSLIGE
jgi:hypothetical protein